VRLEEGVVVATVTGDVAISSYGLLRSGLLRAVTGEEDCGLVVISPA
jgi:hypothetical protein